MTEPASLHRIDRNGKREAMHLADYLIRKLYHDNSVDAVVALFDDEGDCFSWIGPADDEYAVGSTRATHLFEERESANVPCIISDERYDVIEPAPGIYLVTATFRLSSDPAADVFFSVRQRASMGFRIRDGFLKCFHLHLSNPSASTADGEDPSASAAGRSFERLREQLLDQARILKEQSAEIASIYATAPCAIMRLSRTANGFEPEFINPAAAKILGISEDDLFDLDWSGGYCGLLSKEDAQMAESLMAGLNKPGDRAEMVCKLERPSGETVYISSNNEFIGRDERGDIIQKIVFDISDRIALEQALEKQSFEDTLTGMFNRNKFNQLMRSSDHHDIERLGIAYFDINGLKETNDRYGHRAGDDLIRRAASIIMSCFEGKAYRIGGDEFVVIDTESDRMAFESGVSRVCQSMKTHRISIAVGLSFCDEGCDIEKQFDEADKNMYAAKERHYRTHPKVRPRR